jgi:hypothetical protein
MAAAAALSVLPALTTPATPPPPSALLDCPVLPAWCDPTTTSICKNFRSADEYHFVVDTNIKTNMYTITMLDTPHVSLTVSDSYTSPQSYPIQATNVNGTGLAWTNPPSSAYPNTRFVLWRDTLALDVTTLTVEGKIFWHGTCSKVAKPMV